MNKKLNIHIRPATVNDKEFIISLVPRLTEFGVQFWRNGSEMTSTDIEIISLKLTNLSPETAIFVAEDDPAGTPLGFIHLTIGTDYYFKERQGHISDIIVAPEGEGQGIGRRLMAKAEEWARINGFSRLTLSVFAQNVHAREIYERLGYGADIIKYVKNLS